ncbi:uncharacterized protein LOC126702949 [Quercus robur]|uniref:uncharacterized protein LOC126702949 n=1 Tax=Quercus robur TaxID=38942 RepID=UPI002161BB11|nr:uncharacterized protein LOC126702949 [Quercus robur]
MYRVSYDTDNYDYASWALRGAEERYPSMEKLTFALVIVACKLKPYFQAHTVIVLTDKPLWRAMSNPEDAERMALWPIKLSEFDVQYRLLTSLRSSLTWNAKGQKKGDEIECMFRLDFPTTNNEAEYEALIAGLDLVKAAGAVRVVIHCDSQVDTNQVNSDYECKGERMKKYLEQVKRRVDDLQAKIVQISSGENEQVDHLAKAALAELMITPNKVLSFVQLSPLIDPIHMQEIGSESNWTTPLVFYLKNGALLDSKEAARKLKVKATRFVLISDVLYKRGFSCPFLRCLSLEEMYYDMREVHEGIYGNHSRSRSLVHKLIRAGYYWPTMQKDAQAYVKACDKCQRFSNIIRQPTEELTPMTASGPFAQWGLNIMGQFPIAMRQLKYEIPKVLVSDNGKQFDNDSFRDFCSHLGIKNHYSSPAHPQANEQVEVTNRSLFKIIKTRLDGANGVWPEELSSVLWAYRTTTKTPTRETSFQLAYGSEAVIPAEVGLTSYKHYNSRVRYRDFKVGDLILRKVMGVARDPTQGKLGRNWDEPYRITSWHKKDTYHLETLDGQKLYHPWNTEHLRKYYQ